jgi:mannose-6-phosphate isomerase-like protein (cupin superfamily)
MDLADTAPCISMLGNTLFMSWKEKAWFLTEKKTQQIKNGDSVFVAPNDLHQFQNKSQKTLAFLCIEPSTKE